MAIIESLKAARNRDFRATLYTEYYGDPLPMVGATVKMEVRAYPGAEGPALAQDPDVDVISDIVIGREVDPADGIEKDVRQLTIEPSIPKASLDALPGQDQPEAGDTQIFSYEIMIIYADSARDSLWIGDFPVEPGVVA